MAHPGINGAFFDKVEENNIPDYEKLCKEFEGGMIKCHWSRYGTGKCLGCSAEIWHDFVGGYAKVDKKNKHVKWKYYFRKR